VLHGRADPADDAELTHRMHIPRHALERLGTRMILLGGTAFEGPVPLADWAPDRRATGVFAICVPAEGDPGTAWQVLFVGEFDAAARTGEFARHARFSAWTAAAGDMARLHLAFHNMPSQDSRHREAIVRSLVAEYHPPAND
jgi:hypothetical protein